MRSNSGNAIPSGRAPEPERRVSDEALRSEIERLVGADRFRLWFGEGVSLIAEPGSVRIQVPNTFFRDWIETHFAGAVAQAAETLTGRPMRVTFAVTNEAVAGQTGVVVDTQSPPREVRPTIERPAPRPTEADAFLPGRRTARRLDTFIVGASNQLAHAAAVEMAQSTGASFNPLLIHGGVGLGKSHLLEAIAAAFRARRPGWNVVHLTAEAFTNRFLEAMRSGTLAAFRNRFRSADALLVDDVHFLASKRATQLEFLHTFNALHGEGRPIVLSCDQSPANIARLTDELATRFLAGMVVRIDPPDHATRRAIARAKAAMRGVELPSDVLDYLAAHARASVRELEGALQSLLATATLVGARIDMNLARQTLREAFRQSRDVVSIKQIELTVTRFFGLENHALRSPSRHRQVALARALAMHLARKHAGAAYGDIGAHFGGRGHSTVIAADQKVQKLIDENSLIVTHGGREPAAQVIATLEQELGV